MKRMTRSILAAGTAAVAVGFVGAGAASASTEGADQPATGEALERASAAALAHTGGGEVTDSEVGDEEGYYEIEVTLDGGGQVDVHLDENFAFLGAEAEDPGEQDDADL